MYRFYGSKKFRQLPRRSGSKNFPSSKMELFVTMTQKSSSCFKVHFHKCCRTSGSAYVQNKFKTEETLKVPWCIPYWFASIIRFKRSMHWPIFEAGFGGITNSWSIKAGHINALAAFKRHSAKYAFFQC